MDLNLAKARMSFYPKIARLNKKSTLCLICFNRGEFYSSKTSVSEAEQFFDFALKYLDCDITELDLQDAKFILEVWEKSFSEGFETMAKVLQKKLGANAIKTAEEVLLSEMVSEISESRNLTEINKKISHTYTTLQKMDLNPKIIRVELDKISFLRKLYVMFTVKTGWQSDSLQLLETLWCFYSLRELAEVFASEAFFKDSDSRSFYTGEQVNPLALLITQQLLEGIKSGKPDFIVRCRNLIDTCKFGTEKEEVGHDKILAAVKHWACHYCASVGGNDWLGTDDALRMHLLLHLSAQVDPAYSDMLNKFFLVVQSLLGSFRKESITEYFDGLKIINQTLES